MPSAIAIDSIAIALALAGAGDHPATSTPSIPTISTASILYAFWGLLEAQAKSEKTLANRIKYRTVIM
jgi:hypothetical protein